MDLSDLMGRMRASQEERNESLLEFVQRRQREFKEKLALLEKLEREIHEYGAEKLDRITKMAAGDDPDKIEPVMKVGPHGPGCECNPDDPDAEEAVQ